MTDLIHDEFSDEQIAEMMEAIGRRETDYLVLSKVREAAQSFRGSRAEPTRIRFAGSKSKLSLICVKASELQALLEDLDPDTLLHFDIYAINPDLVLGDGFIKNTSQALEDLRNAASKAVQEVPQDIGGREGDEALSMLVYRLYRVFFEATGQQPTHTWNPKEQHFTSRFNRFVFTVVLALDPDAGERAVADAIARAIKLHKAKISPDIG
jgi:hypothetical protein